MVKKIIRSYYKLFDEKIENWIIVIIIIVILIVLTSLIINNWNVNNNILADNVLKIDWKEYTISLK